MSESVEQRIKKLQKELEAPITNISNRKKRNEIRKEIKKLKAQKKPLSPLLQDKKPKKPKPNVAAEKKKALQDIKNGSKKAPSTKAKALPRPAPPVNPGRKASKLPRARKAMARLRPPSDSGPFPGRARPVAAPTPRKVARPVERKDIGSKGMRGSEVRPVVGSKGMRGSEKKPIRPSVTRPIVGSKGMRGSEKKPIRPSVTRPVVGSKGMRGSEVRPFVGSKGMRGSEKKPIRQTGGDASAAEAAYKASQKRFAAMDALEKDRGRKKPKKSTFGFKQISGPTDWSGGKKEYETPWGNIKIDSRSYEETLSPQEREQLEASYKKGGKIGKKKHGGSILIASLYD